MSWIIFFTFLFLNAFSVEYCDEILNSSNWGIFAFFFPIVYLFHFMFSFLGDLFIRLFYVHRFALETISFKHCIRDKTKRSINQHVSVYVALKLYSFVFFLISCIVLAVCVGFKFTWLQVQRTQWEKSTLLYGH